MIDTGGLHRFQDDLAGRQVVFFSASLAPDRSSSLALAFSLMKLASSS